MYIWVAPIGTIGRKRVQDRRYGLRDISFSHVLCDPKWLERFIEFTLIAHHTQSGILAVVSLNCGKIIHAAAKDE